MATYFTLNGDYNGFYSATAPANPPQFGITKIVDQLAPFAPTTFTYQGTTYPNVENGQGGYYLRAGSPFIGPGTASVPQSLKNDLAHRTTYLPDVISDDISSSTTISPRPIGDQAAQNLGFHYPNVDFIVLGATVNNCTLNIDQGTVLGRTSYYPYFPYYWGIRLNPGGRLNVNGVPTNRVVFAHMEAIHESPLVELVAYGPTISWRDLVLNSGPVAPFPEVKCRYADFPALGGGWSGHFDADVNFGVSRLYSIIKNLELDGCLLQGASFFFDDGGPAGRTVSIRNTVFDRCTFGVFDANLYEPAYGVQGYSATILAANNLFYHSLVSLFPVPGAGSGASWTFIDNIFDNVQFDVNPSTGALYNGPVGINHHNAYVGMSGIPNGGNRLSPAAPTSTDPDLASLGYLAGAVGKFYIPVTANLLVDKGSRLASAAGLFHFTSFTNNVKEGNEIPNPKQVNIGPHYLALIAGGAADSNADSIPDFIADRNGDGNETGEIPWVSANNGPLAILSPVPNSSVSGILQLHVNPGPSAIDIGKITAVINNGQAVPDAVAIEHPATSIAAIELDTTYLQDGDNYVSVRAYSSLSGDVLTAPTKDSAPIRIVTFNGIKKTQWQHQADLLVNVNLEVPASLPNYTLYFFNAGYPKSSDPFGGPFVNLIEGVANAGTIAYSAAPGSIGYGTGDVDPSIFTFTELAPTPTSPPSVTSANALIQNNPPFPGVGMWVATYDDGAIDFYKYLNIPVSDLLDLAGNRYVHDDQLNNGWFTCGPFAGSGNTLAIPAPPTSSGTEFLNSIATSTAAQTWPVRGSLYYSGLFAHEHGLPKLNLAGLKNDLLQVNAFVTEVSARNIYALAHGDFWFFNQKGLPKPTQRYRFAFLDGCESFSWQNFTYFGASLGEVGLAPQPGIGNPGWPDVVYYQMTGLRPAAWVGNVTEEAGGYRVSPADDDPTTHFSCDWRLTEANGSWHGQFLFYWVLVGLGVADAKDQADLLTWGPLADPEPPSPSLRQVGTDYLGNPVYWDPTYCRKIAGYVNLRFNDYNHAADTW